MFKPGAFFILTGIVENGGVHETVSGMIAPPFGIYDRKPSRLSGWRWSVTHLPTGRCIADSRNGFACIALVWRLHRELPGAFDNLSDAQGAGQLSDQVRSIAWEIGELRFGGNRRMA